MLSLFARKAAGASVHPAFPAPSVFEGVLFRHNSGETGCENAKVCLDLEVSFRGTRSVSPESIPSVFSAAMDSGFAPNGAPRNDKAGFVFAEPVIGPRFAVGSSQ